MWQSDVRCNGKSSLPLMWKPPWTRVFSIHIMRRCFLFTFWLHIMLTLHMKLHASSMQHASCHAFHTSCTHQIHRWWQYVSVKQPTPHMSKISVYYKQAWWAVIHEYHGVHSQSSASTNINLWQETDQPNDVDTCQYTSFEFSNDSIQYSNDSVQYLTSCHPWLFRIPFT